MQQQLPPSQTQPTPQVQTPHGQGFQSQGQPGQQSQMGQQVQQGQGYQQVPSREFSQIAPFEVEQAVVDLDEFETVAEWAHTKSMEQGHHEVATITDQLAEIAHLEKKLILGQSPFAQTFARCTDQSIQQGVQQLQQFAQDPTVQEVLEYAQYTSQTLGRAEQQLQQWGQIQQSGRMGQVGQPAGQPGVQSGGQQVGGTRTGTFQSQQY